jgi:putative protein kinase ArgK-like GTPase of G3E family
MMFTWYRNWKLKELKKLQEQLDAQEQANRPQFARAISEEAEKHRDSKEPWVTVVGETVTDEGIKIELDWNESFVKFLKAQGLTGKDETQIVQKWLSMIAKQTADKMSENYETLEGKTSEFE